MQPPPPPKKNGRGGWGIVVLKIIRMLLCRSNCLSYHEQGGGHLGVFFGYDFDTDSYEKRKHIEINMYSNNGTCMYSKAI